MASFNPGTPEWWLTRLTERLMSRQERYARQHAYAIGDHPPPPGDERYARLLRQLMVLARTNYIGLANRAVTDRMTVKDFKFGDEDSDADAMDIWGFNNMDLQSVIAVQDAAKFGESYTMVSPGVDGKPPLITVEDPRQCITEQDPIDPMRSVAGLKLYEDPIQGVMVAVLMLEDATRVYHGKSNNFGASDANNDTLPFSKVFGMNAVSFELVETFPNELEGEIALVRGAWQPDHGRFSAAECNDDTFDIQDRINFVILSRLVIAHNQAYRQRWGVGVDTPVNKKGQIKPPFDPGADKVWITSNEKAKFGDFEQADITQLLEAARDDIGDLAAVTQTPVTYLTNRMINVSGEALTSAQAALVSKVKKRMKAMGWYFEQVMRLVFKAQGDARAEELRAEVIWSDPEIRSEAEMADMVSKFASAGVPLKLIMERAGFTAQEIEFAVAEAERVKAEEQAQQVDMMKQQAALAPKPAPTGAAPKPKPKA